MSNSGGWPSVGLDMGLAWRHGHVGDDCGLWLWAAARILLATAAPGTQDDQAYEDDAARHHDPDEDVNAETNGSHEAGCNIFQRGTVSGRILNGHRAKCTKFPITYIHYTKKVKDIWQYLDLNTKLRAIHETAQNN